MAILKGRKYSWLYVIWVVVGIVIAWERAYLTAGVLKVVVSTILSIFLWPLVLIGISLHIH